MRAGQLKKRGIIGEVLFGAICMPDCRADRAAEIMATSGVQGGLVVQLGCDIQSSSLTRLLKQPRHEIRLLVAMERPDRQILDLCRIDEILHRFQAASSGGCRRRK
jgi:hypothetical protein